MFIRRRQRRQRLFLTTSGSGVRFPQAYLQYPLSGRSGWTLLLIGECRKRCGCIAIVPSQCANCQPEDFQAVEGFANERVTTIVARPILIPSFNTVTQFLFVFVAQEVEGAAPFQFLLIVQIGHGDTLPATSGSEWVLVN